MFFFFLVSPVVLSDYDEYEFVLLCDLCLIGDMFLSTHKYWNDINSLLLCGIIMTVIFLKSIRNHVIM